MINDSEDELIFIIVLYLVMVIPYQIFLLLY